MQHPVRITVRGAERSAALEEAVMQRSQKLDQFFPQLIGLDVTIALEDHSKNQGNHYAVKLVLQIPGNDIVIDQQRDEDAYVAVRDAFDAAERRLKDVASRNRPNDRARRRAGTA
ncbi:MAG: ribosome-associated translation inhibitor RaiA [Betaproteobacteria bacterium]|nr:MAG: ribosome-associated translation inhibitor RaiA [Betaproteobacteria bacterium]